MKAINKNIVVILLIISVLAWVLSACGGSQNTNDGTMTTPTTPTTPIVDTTIPDNIDKQPLSITCISGTPACYTYDGKTLTFTRVSAESVYAISGTLEGNIVIDTGDNYKFFLELHGFTLLTREGTPIVAYSGSEIEIKAKNGFKNYIYDDRDAIDSEYAICSDVDLEISGKGDLEIISPNNGGIYTKDDLQVKNLNLRIVCKGNALRGNDGIELLDSNTVLISSNSDCIKTTNSHINTSTGNQKGTVYISGGTHFIYAACDGIDSAYDVVIENSATCSTYVNIFTNKYSEYSNDTVATSAMGVKSANKILIKSGSVSIQSYDYGICAKNDGGILGNGNSPKCDVTISGGTVNIKSHNKGIQADGNLNTAAGTVNVEEFCE